MSKDRKDLRLVRPEEPIDADALEAATDALRRAVSPTALDALDHEALLAMTLGDDVSELGEAERAQAERLRQALDGELPEGGDPLADLACALEAAHAPVALSPADHEAILALALGQDGAFDEDERQQAEVLARALEGDGWHEMAGLVDALRAANAVEREAVLSPADGELLLALSLGDEALSLSGAERADADALRRALEGDGDHPLVGLSEAIRACGGRHGDIDALGHERILRRALLGPDPRHGQSAGRGTVVAALVALAAAIALFAGSWRWLETRGEPTAQNAHTLDLVMSRSTSELFDPMMPFPAKGGESERMGRIVRARQADLRQNRFASWGVR